VALSIPANIVCSRPNHTTLNKNMARSKHSAHTVPSEMIPVFPKTPGQQRFVDSLWENKITLCIAPAGSGKAEALDELVLTPNGMVRIDSLKVGDLVRSATLGKDVKVLGVFPQGVTKAYRVHFSDGTSVVTNPEHLWTVRDENKKANDGFVTITTQEILDGSKKNRSTSESYRYSVLAYTPKIQGESNPWAYFEGLMLGNGYFGSCMLQISTGRRDYEEIVETLKPLISPSNIYFPENSNTVQLNFSWKDLPEHLLKYKHCGDLSGEKEIKNNWYIWDYQSQVDLLAGLYDADGGGCCSSDKRVRLSFTSTSKKLIDLFKNLVRHTGGRACEEKLDSRTHKYTSGYCASVKFRHPVMFSRLKAKTFVRGKRQYSMSSTIVSVTPEKDQETVCISIDAEDGLYVTTGYKMTHNTLLAIHEALKMQKQRLINDILYTRPLIDFPSLNGVGFLPGEEDQKLAPMLLPIRDNLKVFCGEGIGDYLIRQKKIAPILLQDLPGRSLNHTFLIFDEAQNAIPLVVEMVLTRLGDNAKVVIMGDYSQKQSKDKFSDGLTDAVILFGGFPEVGVVAMGKEDVQRAGGLVGRIQEMYRSRREEVTR
jgi:phosphate starvation-inducible protein PhoH